MAENLHAAKLKNRFGESVTFEVTPDIIETRNVNYNTVDPTHMPGQIFTYKNTSSRVYNVSNIRFVSRTQSEAQRNLIWLWRLRGWCMPYFGSTNSAQLDWDWPEWDASSAEAENNARRGSDSEVASRTRILDQQRSATSNFGINPLGTPPDILFFSAYSTGNDRRQHISKIPVIMQQLSIPYPSDVDYITTPSGVPMPTIMTLDMTLAETHSPREFENFSLSAFKQGLLGGF